MRFHTLALVASAAVLSACGGGDKQPGQTDSAAASAASATPAAAAPAANAVAYAAPTGATHDIKMVQDDKGYHFVPNTITIKQGDALNFVVVSGQPHSVTFDPAIPEPARDQINANMLEKASDLNSNMLINPGDHFTVSFAKIPPGTYAFHCTPHLQYGMTGTVTVQ
ncbi:MAG TPA: plastocyanin/azurin family copper-binding protein [Gemmatimonadaceae bacterium]|nr:plastocyanin/azurin family copper-binding protein [Gemmatimonadaceae bacterium]